MMQTDATMPRLSRDGFRDFQVVHDLVMQIAEDARAAHNEDDVLPTDEAKRIAAHAFQVLRSAVEATGRASHPERGDRKMDRRYMLACYADEAMLNPRLGIERHWLGRLLEEDLFGTRVAGDRVLREAADIVAARDVARKDVAMCAYLALTCGFRGRYGGRSDQGLLDPLKVGLYDVAMDRAIPEDPSHVFAQVFDHTRRGTRESRPSRPVTWKTWATWLAPIVIVYLLLSHAIWGWHFGAVASLADDIRDREESIDDLRAQQRDRALDSL